MSRDKTRGKICRLCERKFLVKNMVKEELKYINTQRDAIDNFQEHLAEKKKAYVEVSKMLEDEAHKGKEAMEELQETKKELKEEIETLVNEMKSMIQEVEELENRKQQLVSEH